jgi:eukaryotic translation initiation factor 2C
MYYGKLNPTQTNAMLKFATQKPQEKLQALRTGLNLMKFGSPTLRKWNMDVNVDAPMKARARILDAPRLHYR